MAVPLLKQGDLLIASIQAAVSDADLNQMQNDLLYQVRAVRACRWVGVRYRILWTD
jgi:rsbT antagonist protein RsbS